jgi:simple sugar transport system ATP-binding protein/ribose transport system ATP-binding protein
MVPLLKARAVSKQFGGAQALVGVDLSLDRGEVHCLVGENGAGKSTLGKIIAGVVQLDGGSVEVDGKHVDYRAPRDALRDGITIVEQELSLVPAMTVAENVLLGIRGRGRAGSARRLVERLSSEFSLDLDVGEEVGRLPVAEQQKVEILRALARGSRLVVMDEPTARLAGGEAANLRKIIRRLAESGTTVVYVSHFLDEVLEVGDNVTVLRNGRVVRSSPARHETEESLVTAMLGREAVLGFPEKVCPDPSAIPVLEVEDLRGRKLDGAVGFAIQPGQIVGLAGLVGSGRTEVARLIFGADRPTGGRVRIDGEDIRGASTSEVISKGVSYLPESRKDLGLFMRMSSQENVTLSALGRVCRLGLVDRRRERRETSDVLERLAVHPPHPRARVETLSGGNQQKVLFAKWLWHSPRLLIADEPTRGVDVAAKFGIYELLAELAAGGMGVLLISSELDEIVGLSSRVVVMARRRQVAVLDGGDVCEDRILRCAFGGGVTKAAA